MFSAGERKNMIKTYDEFYKFFGDYPRDPNFVDNHGRHVIIKREDWDEKYLKEFAEVVFDSSDGDYSGPRYFWIVNLIIDEIAKIDNDFYQKLRDEKWFQENINPDYACIYDLYADYEMDYDTYFEEIQSGKWESYDAYIHEKALDYTNYLKTEISKSHI